VTRVLLVTERLVAVEGGGRAGVIEPLDHLEAGRSARLLALARHGGIEGLGVHRHAALAAHVGREVEGEAVGVVQLEGDLAVEALRAAGERRLEDLHAVGDGLEEALFLLLSTSVMRAASRRSSG
jgi:hypothetical protein